jgi:hypothetical protein
MKLLRNFTLDACKGLSGIFAMKLPRNFTLDACKGLSGVFAMKLLRNFMLDAFARYWSRVPPG